MKAFVSAAMATGAALTAACLLSGCSGGGSSTVKAADIQGDWPLTVDQVKLVCREDLAIYAEADGKTYPLNGQAERNEDGYKKGELGRISDIQKDDPTGSALVPGIKMSLTPLLRTAIERCDKAGKWKI